MAKKRIGELLLEKGAVNHDQLQLALAAQRHRQKRLGATLVEQGVITEEQLVTVLSEALGIARVDVPSIKVEWAAVHMLRARFCEQHDVMPLSIDGKGTSQKSLSVAMADPLNHAAIEEIEFTTGLKVNVRLASLTQIRTAVGRFYPPADLPRAVTREAPIVVGTELSPPPPEVTTEPNAPVTSDPVTSASGRTGQVQRDLAFLYGGATEEQVRDLEKKFWALLRLLKRKGVITNDEVAREFEALSDD